MNANTVLWVYIGLLIVGGLAGYLKAKSHISLYTSFVAAAILALCAFQIAPPIVADVLMGLLIVVFGIRFLRTRKIMPAGMMLLLTILALAARHLPLSPPA
jgi:uncharacterized membrane protein (UPF0136 family)